MSQLSHPTWNVSRSSAVCAACGHPMEAGQACWATLVETLASVAPAPTAPASAPASAPVAGEPAPAVPASATSEGPAAPHSLSKEPKAAALDYERLDYCEECWQAGKRPAAPQEMFSFWKTSVPAPTQKKKLFVDDSVLMDLFTRLEEKEAPQDIRFRFVLALILMRKRLLKYEGSENLPLPAGPEGTGEGGGTQEVWTMTPRGENATAARVINPQLTPEQISEVSQQLTQVLAEEI